MTKIQQISTALKSHPVRIIEPGERAHAAVALVLKERSDGLNILFVKRSTNENDYWSGQIGFPGGRTESGDGSLKETAERETREEIGLDLSTGHYLGRLSDIAPGGLQIVVSCFIYAIKHHPALHLAQNEIADAFWVPVRELVNPARRSQVDFTFRNRKRRFPAVRVDDKGPPLWGITYRLLRDFNKTIHRTIDPDRYQ
ncbi:DNA mismatch repair protein MutT/NUDIX hydrolase [Desulfuromonas soudanensis]|uniref:DNA mismatch repair protein MutT/NUDIX hydrolase n=1 Tax=Desulfuromonas soudanensis TaxID=1603606 RepID=A0A0M4DBR0_9BACT|nr:CoA pyrophosphatase [Desulfuromonas soudanensis]ALC17855.1 DNA mismatch repair protein MutT/NUDIX hydrolase [Desulfuromonas soudanensis]